MDNDLKQRYNDTVMFLGGLKMLGAKYLTLTGVMKLTDYVVGRDKKNDIDSLMAELQEEFRK